ncbi:MAG TPA: EAL domain-containing protein [Gemmatimonadales bacterium]
MSPVESRLLDSVLAPGGLRTLFHPIYEVSGAEGTKLWAVEALIRGPRNTNLESAVTLFEFVRRKRAEPVVDRACIRTALGEARHIPNAPSIGLNVHASTLGRDPDFLSFLLQTALENEIAQERLIVEIVEQVPYYHERTFRRNLDQLRNRGIRVALDDVGVGHSNLRMILETRPQVLKIDGTIVRGCHADYYRWALLEWTQTLAARLGAWPLAEGIEDQADLAAVTACGIRLVQGFVFCKPMPAAELAAVDLVARARLVLAELPLEAA